MKQNLKMFSAFAALAIFATACNDNGVDSGIDNSTDDEKGFVQLTVNAATPATRAADEGESTAVTGEFEVDPNQGLTVVVFNEDGSFNNAEQSMTLTQQSPNVYVTTDKIAVDAGKLFYFVFANNGDSKITIPAATDNIDDFMTDVLHVNYLGHYLDIAQTGNFLLGSLWREKTFTAAGGTTTNPVMVQVPEIGRLAAKVVLDGVVYTKSASSPMKGTFSAAKYRPGSVATEINFAGVHKPAVAAPLWDGTDLPYAPNTGVLVVSALHDEDEGTALAPNTKFLTNLDFVFAPEDQAFYIPENTTARDAVTGFQYFGNTSYIQIETVYTPDQSEVFDPSTGYAVGTLGNAYTGTAFFSGVVAGQRYLYSTNPSGVVANISDVKQYSGGKNYHKFPIFDAGETDDLAKNRVLRNHHYTFNVTGFSDLGDNTETVDPTDPIASSTTVQIEVSVKDWDKVTVGEVEL